MANTSDIKNGMVLNHNNGLWQIVEFLHVKPGKGAAFVRTKLKNIETGKVVDHTFNAGHKIDPVRIETREHQFLYNDDEGYHFMNTDTYEQTFVPQEVVVDAMKWTKESDVIELTFYEGEVIDFSLPANVELEITETEPGVAGNTVSGASKPATLETGAEVQVPLFVNIGEKIKVDTRSGAYISRA